MERLHSETGRMEADGERGAERTGCYFKNDYTMPYITPRHDIVYESYRAPQFKIVTKWNTLILHAFLPDFTAESISVVYDTHELIIAGRVPVVSANTTGTTEHDRIKTHASFYRELCIPMSVRAENIRIRYKNKRLIIALPLIVPVLHG